MTGWRVANLITVAVMFGLIGIDYWLMSQHFLPGIVGLIAIAAIVLLMRPFNRWLQRYMG